MTASLLRRLPTRPGKRLLAPRSPWTKSHCTGVLDRTLHRFTYVGNNPVGAVDPSGLKIKFAPGLGAGGRGSLESSLAKIATTPWGAQIIGDLERTDAPVVVYGRCPDTDEYGKSRNRIKSGKLKSAAISVQLGFRESDEPSVSATLLEELVHTWYSLHFPQLADKLSTPHSQWLYEIMAQKTMEPILQQMNEKPLPTWQKELPDGWHKDIDRAESQWSRILQEKGWK